MGKYDAYKPSVTGTDYVDKIPSFMDAVGSDVDGKAPAQHTHGAGGEVVGIGLSTSRPAVADGYLYSETDTGQVVVLKADGTLASSLVALDGAIYVAMLMGGRA